MGNLLEKVRDNAGYDKDFNSRNGDDTMIIVESIAICFQALIDKLEEIRQDIQSEAEQKFNVELYKESK